MRPEIQRLEDFNDLIQHELELLRIAFLLRDSWRDHNFYQSNLIKKTTWRAAWWVIKLASLVTDFCPLQLISIHSFTAWSYCCIICNMNLFDADFYDAICKFRCKWKGHKRDINRSNDNQHNVGIIPHDFYCHRMLQSSQLSKIVADILMQTLSVYKIFNAFGLIPSVQVK